MAGKGPALERGDEVVDRDRGQRLVAGRAARAELERDPRDGALVGRLDDGDEVDVAERGPLRLAGGAQLPDLLVDLEDPLRIVLDRLHALGREGREHDVGGHVVSSSLGWRWRAAAHSARFLADRKGLRERRARGPLDG